MKIIVKKPPFQKFTRFYMNILGWICLGDIIESLSLLVAVGTDGWGEFFSSDIDICTGLLLAPFGLYAMNVFADEAYKPYKWNIVGRFLKWLTRSNALYQ